MLKANIALADLALDVQWRDDSIVFGGSSITPFAHSSLETLLVCTEGQWFAVVRERDVEKNQGPVTVKVVDAEEFGRLYRTCLLWPLDYLMVEVAKSGMRMKLRAGVISSAPVYCRAIDDSVTVSWNLADFLAKSVVLDLEILSHYLALNTVYSYRQVCTGVNLLTERAILYIEPGIARYQYPLPVERPQPNMLLDGDALEEFSALLYRAVSARPMTANKIAIELSGGMDSATVASVVTKQHDSVASLGILLDGQVRSSQVERRQRIMDRLSLLDKTVDMKMFPPSLDLQPTQVRVERPYGEYYLEAFEALWDSVHEQGRNILFTGIGGDELFPTYIGEACQGNAKSSTVLEKGRLNAAQLLTPRAQGAARTLRAFDAPAAPVPASALLAHVCQAPYLLQRGIWPVNPLSDPSLIAFCHRLPKESRHGRQVMRQYLQASLGEGVFTHDYVKETFARVLPEQICQQAKTITIQLQCCALADLGLVDRRAVLQLLEDVINTQEFALAAPLATFLWLERFVRHVG